MDIVVVAAVALIGSLLTFFSGFGLGTILTPVFVIFFPVEIAIALTAIVHLLNNFFKIVLVGKHIDWKIGIKFGVMAIAGAYLGAKLLFIFSDNPPLYIYSINNKLFYITTIKLIIALLMIAFALIEVIPSLKNIQFKGNRLYAGGLLSGFFGGLSGNQGALRSMFLIRSNVTKESFIATGVFIACLIDVTRLIVYFKDFSRFIIHDNMKLLIIATLSAFLGAFIGSKLLHKVTFSFLKVTVTVMIIVLAIGLGSGIL